MPGVEELTGGDPEVEVVENAREGLRQARGSLRARVVGLTADPTRTWCIACDTDVVLDGKALGKPAGRGEAREYLERMSGRAHTVMSGLVVLADGEERVTGWNGRRSSSRADEAENERYVRFGEWRGRSGGYAIQTLGSTLVERIEGSVSNVVGLPVGLLLELAPELVRARA